MDLAMDTNWIVDFPSVGRIKMANCTVCKKTMKSRNKKKHLRSNAHQLKVAEMRAEMESSAPAPQQESTSTSTELALAVRPSTSRDVWPSPSQTQAVAIPGPGPAPGPSQEAPAAPSVQNIFIVSVNSAASAAEIINLIKK